VNENEQAAFDALVSELNSALAMLDQPPVRENPAFAIEPDHPPSLMCVVARREGAADLQFMLEGDWVRVDIAGLPECLAMPLPSVDARHARKHDPMSETLSRLLTSKVTFRRRGRRRNLFLTDPTGRVWGRNTYLGFGLPRVPRGPAESHEFEPTCPSAT
jgi:hypothetical protein